MSDPHSSIGFSIWTEWPSIQITEATTLILESHQTLLAKHELTRICTDVVDDHQAAFLSDICFQCDGFD